MNEFTERQTESSERVLQVTVFGNSSDEIEMAALDKAREFFGSEVELELGHYEASANVTLSAPGKRYVAGVKIYARTR